MDFSKESYHEKNRHTIANKNEIGSSLSSDSDQTPKSFHKKKKEKKNSKQLFTPEYFPVYTPSWATMNYIYLDLLRQLSMESEIRSNVTKIDQKYDYSYLKDFQAKKKFEEEQCRKRKKVKHKLNSCEDFAMPCSHLCLSCHQKLRCNSCGHTIMLSRAPEKSVKDVKSLKHCKCTYDSCTTLLDLQHIPLSCCHYQCQKPLHPCHSLKHNVCGSLNHIPVDTPVREMPELYKSTKRPQNPLDSEADDQSDSNVDELLDETNGSVGSSIYKGLINKNQPVLQIPNKDVNRKHNFEDDSGLTPSFIGGTGDEGSKIEVKHTRKSRLPQSTAYFLPISS